MPLRKWSRALLLCACVAVTHGPTRAHAQGGPPYFTNDPGTPGNANWEINIAATQEVLHASASYEMPQIDLNFGVGDRIQLTYEVPYVLATRTGDTSESGWSNAYPGVKWRFLDQGEDGWQISTFPQLETGVSTLAERDGLGSAGPRFLLPVEFARKVGPVDLDFEAGYYLPWHGPHERILGLVLGHTFTPKFELDAEIYDDRAQGALPSSTTLDVGGRYQLHRGIIALFMAGRGIAGASEARPRFIGYFGIQVLLSHYGRTLDVAPSPD